MSESAGVLIKRTIKAGFALALHTVLIGGSIVIVYGIEQLIHQLWTDTDPQLFDRVPLRWLFQAIDSAMIVVFGFCGVTEAYRILRG
jgi:hypothetical protein